MATLQEVHTRLRSNFTAQLGTAKLWYGKFVQHGGDLSSQKNAMLAIGKAHGAYQALVSAYVDLGEEDEQAMAMVDAWFEAVRAAQLPKN